MESACGGKPIVLWSHPRSTSTAFERAFMEREAEFRCYHEPFGHSFYFGPDRLSTRYAADEIPDDWRRRSTIESVVAAILSGGRCDDDAPVEAQQPPSTTDTWNGNGNCRHEADIAPRVRRPLERRIFVKDMAQYVVSPASGSVLLSCEFLRQVHHTFLIRTPLKAVPSYYRLCIGEEADITCFRYFDPSEAGYREQRILFDHLRELLGKPPVVVDSQDLLDNPEAVMRAYCHAVGVDFCKKMLGWDARPVKEFEIWPGFHVDVENSTGLGKLSNGWRAGPPLELPDDVQQCITNNLPDYEYLRQFRLQPAPQLALHNN